MLMAVSLDLIILFLALEAFSIALYVLAGIARRRRLGQEAALKYFIAGAFASAVLLYGIALTYVSAGTTNLVSRQYPSPPNRRVSILRKVSVPMTSCPE